MSLLASIAVNDTADVALADASWVEVHERMGEPATFRIRFEIDIADGDLPLLSDRRLDAGSTLAVRAPSGGEAVCLVKGPVVAQRVHLEHGGSGSYLEVRGGDAAVAMDREARSAVWADVTDSDVVTQIFQRYGFVPDVAATTALHAERAHALVQRESDLAFVKRLARRNGFLFWLTAAAVGPQTAHFKPPPLDGRPAATLAINVTPPQITALDLRWDAERPTRVDGAQLRLNDKSALDGDAQRSPLRALGARDLAAITGDTRSVFLSAPVDDAGDLQARAGAALAEAGWFVRATGETRRETAGTIVRAHSVVRLNGAGRRHSGAYFVAGVRHTIDATTHRMELELLRNAWDA